MEAANAKPSKRATALLLWREEGSWLGQRRGSSGKMRPEWAGNRRSVHSEMLKCPKIVENKRTSLMDIVYYLFPREKGVSY